MKKLPLKDPSHKQLAHSFGQWMDILGYCQGAVTYYPIHLREFLHYVEARHHGPLHTLTADFIKGYYGHLRQRPNQNGPGGLSKSSLNAHISSLKLFNPYLKKHGGRPLPVHLRTEKRERLAHDHILGQGEVRQLFKAARHSSENGAICLRDRAVLVALYSCGLRRNEAVHLNVDDILLDRQRIFVRKGKNYKERYVPINLRNMEILEEYLYGARPGLLGDNLGEGAFFVTKFGKRMGGQSLKLRVKCLHLMLLNLMSF